MYQLIAEARAALSKKAVVAGDYPVELAFRTLGRVRDKDFDSGDAFGERKRVFQKATVQLRGIVGRKHAVQPSLYMAGPGGFGSYRERLSHRGQGKGLRSRN